MIWFLREVFRVLEDVQRRVVRMEGALARLERKEGELMATAADVLAAVQAESTVIDSVLAFLQAQASSGATLQQAIDAINQDKTRLEAAIVTGTPSAPPTP